MILNTEQVWTPGAVVRVGFLRLRVVGYRAIKDGLPDIYDLESLDHLTRYEFIPYNGLTKV